MRMASKPKRGGWLAAGMTWLVPVTVSQSGGSL